ncbi:MAG: 4Fe-4S binding protein [Veillonellales bacterium]
MPRGDGTGPLGSGPRGRGRGGCQKMGLNTNLGRNTRGGSRVSNNNIITNQESLEIQAARLEEQASVLRNLATQNRAKKSSSPGTCDDPGIYIITDTCRGCDVCRKVCPAEAISGNIKEQHHIDPMKCIKCGSCMANCPFNAIKKEGVCKT